MKVRTELKLYLVIFFILYPNILWAEFVPVETARQVAANQMNTDIQAEAKYGGGTGEPNEPYLIYDANQMNAIGADSNDWDKCFKLMADIDLSEYSGTAFNIIGVYISYNHPKNKPFTGVFDGNGHTISNFTYASTGTICKGLFRYVRGVIKDLGLIDPNVDAGTGDYVGSLVGYNLGTITGCYVEGGSISGNGRVGGLVGYNFSATITNCYSTGSVSGTTDIGGLVGRNIGDVIGSFWDTQTSGQATSAGGTGLTTAEMQMASTFVDWACDAVWTIDEGVDYPRLWWQNMPGEPIATPFYGVGNGTEADPHLIYTAEQLNAIALFPCLRDKHFKLMADINLSGFTGTSFNIIGTVVTPFTGNFDGNGHTISNFSYTWTGTSNIGIGLFGYVDGPNAEIKNLGLIDPNLDAGTCGFTGSLVGYLSRGTITNCYAEAGSVAGLFIVGGLVGRNYYATITNCYSTVKVTGYESVGGLVGRNNYATITNCYSTGSVEGISYVGGLVGWSYGTITNSYSKGSVSGASDNIGGLVGRNDATITNCYSTGSVSGNKYVGGLVGYNYHTITDCYSTGEVSGITEVGGLVGYNYLSSISNCYSSGSVSGNKYVGGLVGRKWEGEVNNSFWDIETSGQATSAGGTGKTTAEMQTMSTFIDAGWDFTTPKWTIDEGVDYPRLWWEFVPVLHAEPEVTLGTSNIISWDPIAGVNDFYAECAEEANFTSIVYNSGWIAETSFEFTGLEVGRQYWYSVKARNGIGEECQWSNVETSLQGTLVDAVEIMLDPNNLKSENLKKPYINKINIAQDMIDAGVYTGALSKLENDILPKTDGCAKSGEPDESDWIITCEEQAVVYPLVIETIEYIKSIIE